MSSSIPLRTPPKPDSERLADYERLSIEKAVADNFYVVRKKAQILANADRKDEAIKALKVFGITLGENNPFSNSVAKSVRQTEMFNLPLPDLKVERSLGDFKNLSDLKGKVVILDFRSPLIGRNREGFWQLRLPYDDHRSNGLEVLTVSTFHGQLASVEEELAKIEATRTQIGLKWPLAYIPRSEFETFASIIRPNLVILDRKGNVRFMQDDGPVQGSAKLAKLVMELLKEN